MLAFGGAEHAKRMGDNLMQCDPLSFAGWRGASSALIWMGDSDRAITIAKSGMEKAPHIRTLQTLFSAYLAAGRFEDAEHLVRRDIRRYDVAKNYATTLVLARGDIEDLDEFESAGFSTLAADVHLRFYAQAGDRDAANARAAELDAHPYGYLALMLVPQVCMCGAPWDLEATPNFARLVADADLQWPPGSPIQWPLKDW